MAKKNTTGSKSRKSQKAQKSKTSNTEKEIQDGSTVDGSSSASEYNGLDDNAVASLREEHDEELKDAAMNVKDQYQEASRGISIVIPYKGSVAKADELIYAIRAWQKFFPDAQIVIIGDLPKTLSIGTGLVHIEHTPTSHNPQIDVAQKLLLACESELVSDAFILTNDDIYPVCPMTLTDIDLHVSKGKLGIKGASGGVYRKNAANTLTALKAEGVKAPDDYATHTPVVMWKKELKEVILKFKANEVGHLLTTLYFNTVWSGHRPVIIDDGNNVDHPGSRSYVACAYKSTIPQAVLKQAFATRKFINVNDRGWSVVEPFLKKLFPSKSKFEK